MLERTGVWGVDRDQNNGNERISSSDEEKRPCSQRKIGILGIGRGEQLVFVWRSRERG